MATATVLGITLTLTPPALTALRIAPLLSSTASLTHAYMEWLTNSSFLVPAPVESKISLFLLGPAAPRPAQPAHAATGGKPALKEKGKEEGKEKQEEEEKDNDNENDDKARDELDKAKQIVVPEWFTNFFNTGVRSVIGFNSLTLVSASLNLVFDQGLSESRPFYQAGLVAAVGHYAFVPLVGGSVRALIGLAATRIGEAALQEGSREEGTAVEWVREWVGYHKIRMSTVDVLALGCFAWGVVHAVTVKG